MIPRDHLQTGNAAQDGVESLLDTPVTPLLEDAPEHAAREIPVRVVALELPLEAHTPKRTGRLLDAGGVQARNDAP